MVMIISGVMQSVTTAMLLYRLDQTSRPLSALSVVLPDAPALPVVRVGRKGDTKKKR